jgi:hypothetical protein
MAVVGFLVIVHHCVVLSLNSVKFQAVVHHPVVAAAAVELSAVNNHSSFF